MRGQAPRLWFRSGAMAEHIPFQSNMYVEKSENEHDSTLKTYDVCQANVDANTKCGCYMPSFYWQKPHANKWRFYCKIDWCQVVAHPGGSEIAQHFESNGFGSDPALWPNTGCGSRFKAWARGPSKVVEFFSDGKWYCFLAERLPEELDNEIKIVQETFARATGRLTVQDLMDSIKISFPETNPVDPVRLPGVHSIIMVAHIYLSLSFLSKLINNNTDFQFP